MINLSSLALLEGEPRRAARLGAEAVALASEQGDAETEAVALFNLACAHLENGEAQLAGRAFADSTRLCLDGGFREHLAYCLVGVARWRSVAAMCTAPVRFSGLPTRCWRGWARRWRRTSACCTRERLRQ